MIRFQEKMLYKNKMNYEYNFCDTFYYFLIFNFMFIKIIIVIASIAKLLLKNKKLICNIIISISDKEEQIAHFVSKWGKEGLVCSKRKVKNGETWNKNICNTCTRKPDYILGIF